MMKCIILLFISIVLATVSLANAESDTGNLEVTTTVSNSCSIGAGGKIDFGVINVGNSRTGVIDRVKQSSTVRWENFE